MMPPGIYLSLPLNILDQVLLAEAAHLEEKEKENKDEQGSETSPVEAEGSVT